MRNGKREVLPCSRKRKHVARLIVIVDITRVQAKQVAYNVRRDIRKLMALGQIHDHLSSFARAAFVPRRLRKGHLLALIQHRSITHGQIIDLIGAARKRKNCQK